MRKRQIIDLPATLADFSRIANSLRAKPCGLMVRDVTYLHFHREFEIGVCISGEGTLFHGDTEQVFGEGDVQLIYPYMGHIHKTDDPDRCRWIWVYIDAEKLLSELGVADFTKVNSLVRKTSRVSGIIDSERFPALCDKLRGFVQRCEEGYADREHMALDFYGMLLSAADVQPKDCEQSESLAPMTVLDPALRRIARDMETGESTSVEALARLCSMSVSGFRRKFSEIMGASPKVYIQACRIRRAKQLLREGKTSILHIALAVGYKDISGFNRSFAESTGETPSAYRKRHR